MWTVNLGYLTRDQQAHMQERTMQVITDYIICVMTAGNSDNCNFDELPYPPYAVIVIVRLMISFYPILLFLVFGARASLPQFWMEYFRHAWKDKRLYLEFEPSFDPSLRGSFRSSTRELDPSAAEEPVPSKLKKEDSFTLLKRLRRAVNDL